MKYFHLVWAGLFRRKSRTFLTLVSIIAAFLLFGLLNTVRLAFSPSDSVVGATRLVTTSKLSMTSPLPKSLYRKIGQVPGVAQAAYANWFGGVYQDNNNRVPAFAISPNYLDLYPDVSVAKAQMQVWRHDRTGVLVGSALAKRFGWQVGDQIPLRSSVWPSRATGNNTWTFKIVGIMHATGSRGGAFKHRFFMHWKYFNENNLYRSDKVHWYAVQVADSADPTLVAKRIDALSANSAHETRTQTEQAFMASFIKRLVDIGLIVVSIMGAVFFTLLLLTGNTMAQAVRERTSELAILKTIGFSSRSVLAMVLAESVLLLLLGGVIGLGIVSILVPGLKTASGGLVPVTGVSATTWLIGIGLMLAIGLLVGAIPAWRAMRLNMVDALRAT